MSTRRTVPAVHRLSVRPLLSGSATTSAPARRPTPMRGLIAARRGRPVARREPPGRPAPPATSTTDDPSRASIIDDVKRQLQRRDGAAAAQPAARAARELRRALFLRRPRVEQLRHGRLPRQRLLHHREARRRRARPGRPGGPAPHHLGQADAQGRDQRRAWSTSATRRSKWIPATGRS